MRPFVYERAPSAERAAQAIQGARRDAPLVQGRLPAEYMAGGTTLLDLMKLDVMQPARVVDISELGKTMQCHHQSPTEGVKLGALAKHVGGGRPSGDHQVLSGPRAEPHARGERATSQHGVARRQRAAADPLQLLPRHVLVRLQQAQPGLGLRGARRLQPTACGAGRAAKTASPPTRATSRRP